MMVPVFFPSARQRITDLLLVVALFTVSSLSAAPPEMSEDSDFSFTNEASPSRRSSESLSPGEIDLPMLRMSDESECKGYLIAQNKLFLTKECKDNSGLFPAATKLTFFGCEQGVESIQWPDNSLQQKSLLEISNDGNAAILTFSPGTLHSTCWAREYTGLGTLQLGDDNLETFSGSGSGISDTMGDDEIDESSGSGDDAPPMHGISKDKSTSYRKATQHKPALNVKDDIKQFITGHTGCSNIEKLCHSQKINAELEPEERQPGLENRDQICADKDHQERVCIIKHTESHPEGQCECKVDDLSNT